MSAVSYKFVAMTRDLGGTIRLGSQKAELVPGSKLSQIYVAD